MSAKENPGYFLKSSYIYKLNTLIIILIIIIIIIYEVEEEPLRGQEGQLVMGVQQRFSLRPSYITSSLPS